MPERFACESIVRESSALPVGVVALALRQRACRGSTLRPTLTELSLATGLLHRATAHHSLRAALHHALWAAGTTLHRATLHHSLRAALHHTLWAAGTTHRTGNHQTLWTSKPLYIHAGVALIVLTHSALVHALLTQVSTLPAHLGIHSPAPRPRLRLAAPAAPLPIHLRRATLLRATLRLKLSGGTLRRRLHPGLIGTRGAPTARGHGLIRLTLAAAPWRH